MKGFIILVILATIGAFMLGVVPQPGTYPVTSDVAAARLMAMRFDAGMLIGTHPARSVSRVGDDRLVRLDFSEDLNKAAICTATLSPRGAARTHLALGCEVPDAQRPRHLSAMLASLMQENVEAAIEDRPFDHGRLGMAATGFVSAHRGESAKATIPPTR